MKCYNCNELGHYSNRCPKKAAKGVAAAATLLEPQLAALTLEGPHVFAAAIGCEFFDIAQGDSDNESSLSDGDWEAFGRSWLLESSEPPVELGTSQLESLETPVELEKAPVELGTSQLESLETPVELEKAPVELGTSQLESLETPVELEKIPSTLVVSMD